MIRIGDREIPQALYLAPMEEVSDRTFRVLCREQGADVVVTEFVNSDGLTRKCGKSLRKMDFHPGERPIGIQIYGQHLEPMVAAARMAAEREPDFIDINAGCWVKKVAGRGAGAGLLKDPDHLAAIVSSVVAAVDIPVTVKTRLGWDENSIHILDNARRIEDAGAAGLTLHCRTRSQGHSGPADWSWIPRVKEAVRFPVVLNGGVMNAEDVVRAFRETGADGVMIARGAIGSPWIFRQAKEALAGRPVASPPPRERVELCLRHLRLFLEAKGPRGITAFRKFYAGYVKGYVHASKVRVSLMAFLEAGPIEERLRAWVDELEAMEREGRSIEAHPAPTPQADDTAGLPVDPCGDVCR
ncbi:MAG: tRNA dihydrouridine synthase DusB [Spirochaetes bacterium]|nr:tRNA dihydrouridine synthase DusB [Spirochaetota bacterium]